MKDRVGADPQNTAWSKDKEGFGYRMLAAMGWSEGKGLGVNEDGLKAPIKVSKRLHGLGIGADTPLDTTNNWLANTSAFSNILNRLQSIGGTANPTPEPEDKEKQPTTPAVVKNRRIRYHKLVNAKTITNHTSEDLSAVLMKQENDDENEREDEVASSPGYTQVPPPKKRKQDETEVAPLEKKRKLGKQDKSYKSPNSDSDSTDSSDSSDSEADCESDSGPSSDSDSAGSSSDDESSTASESDSSASSTSDESEEDSSSEEEDSDCSEGSDSCESSDSSSGSDSD